MDDYLQKYDNYKKNIVYEFVLGSGGIGDFIKFFIYTLSLCIKHGCKLYYLITNNPIEKYILMKHTKMYITKENIKNKINIGNEDSILSLCDDNSSYYFVDPGVFYNSNFTFNCFDDIDIKNVFHFSDEIIMNTNKLISDNITQYISIHLRLGDKYLETDKSFVICVNDERKYNENNLFKSIEENYDKSILFFCDNNSYKLKIKNKYDNITITNSEIGHTSLSNTTDKQLLDTVTEFYLLCNSEKIYSCSYSGFSIVASKFNNIPLIMYEHTWH